MLKIIVGLRVAPMVVCLDISKLGKQLRVWIPMHESGCDKQLIKIFSFLPGILFYFYIFHVTNILNSFARH